MTIRELMDRLGQLDQEAEVLVPDASGGFDEVEYVEQVQDPTDGQRYVMLDSWAGRHAGPRGARRAARFGPAARRGARESVGRNNLKEEEDEP